MGGGMGFKPLNSPFYATIGGQILLKINYTKKKTNYLWLHIDNSQVY